MISIQPSKISIIVPVFNTATYLRKCIDSILGQTYLNYELLIVDDGSTDESPSICDEFASRDSRVKVFHKVNSGVSAARNFGISKAQGEYLMFVDSDDFIQRDMVELLYDTLMQNEADISICRLVKYDEGGHPEVSTYDNRSKVFSGEEAIEDMLYQKDIANMPGGKLYDKRLFEKVKFAEGVSIGEDLGVNYELFLKAKKIVVNLSPLYYYLRRSGSAMRSPFSSKRMSGLGVMKKIYEDIAVMHPRIIGSAESRLFIEAMYIATEIPYRAYRYKTEYDECIHIMKKLTFRVAGGTKVNPKHKAYAVVSLVSANLLIMILKLRRYT